MHTRFLYVIAFLAVAAVAFTQGQAAKRGAASATVAGQKISIDYGRPELKGRSVDELTSQLPEDRMWRAGMNQVTTLETGTALMIGGKKVPAGKYSVYVHAPAKGDWQLVLNSVLGQPLGKVWSEAPDNLKKELWPHFKYSEEIGDKEVVRTTLKKGQINPPVNLFTIDLKSAGDGAKMMMSWGNASWTADLAAAK